jgi:hypothetical protein
MCRDKGFVERFAGVKVNLIDLRFFDKALEQLTQDRPIAKELFIATVMNGRCHGQKLCRGSG